MKTMRQIKTHQINLCNKHIGVETWSEPGPGGAPVKYRLSINANQFQSEQAIIKFQNGPVVVETDVNGITDEALLALIVDRIQCFQKGPFACRENEQALLKLEEGLHWLTARVLERQSRSVEGQLKA